MYNSGASPNVGGFSISPTHNGLRSSTTKNSIHQSQLFDQVEYYKHRCTDLEVYVKQLKNELDLSIQRLATSNEVDEKVKLVLLQNQSLQDENESTKRLLTQKRQECELWKNKYEVQSTSLTQVKANYEIEIKTIQQSLLLLEDKNKKLEYDKNREIEISRNSLLNSQQQIESLEAQVRILRIQLEQEVQDDQTRKERLNQEHIQECTRLQRESDQLRTRLQLKDQEHQHEISSLRSRLESLGASGLANLKAQNQSQVEIFESELEKLRELLGIKNTEIETLLSQNQKYRAISEEEQDKLRLQNDLLKEKMLENEQAFDNQIQELEEKFVAETNSQLDEVNQKLLEQLKQNQYQQDLINQKNEQYDRILKNFSNLKQSSDDSYYQLRKEHELLKQKSQQAQKDNNKKIKEHEWTINRLSQELANVKQQNQITQTELSNKLIDSQSQLEQLQDQIEQVSGQCKLIENQNKQIRDSNLRLKKDFEVIVQQSKTNSQLLEVQNQQILEQALQEQQEQHQQQIEEIQEQLAEQQAQNQIKQKEINEFALRFRTLEQQVRVLSENPSPNYLSQSLACTDFTRELFPNMINEERI